MWSKFKTFLWQTRSALVIAPTVATAVVCGNVLGVFNLLEWEVRDNFFRLRPFEGQDSAIVVVTIDEFDIRAAKDWPIPDEILADLLSKIAEQQPRAIGLDIYRDLPEEPGYDQLVEVFQTTPALIGVEKIIGNRVDPPPALAEVGQVGLADLVLDADRKVRRALLTAEDAEAEGAIKAGLATQVALKYLAADGISLESVDPDRQIFQLGKAQFEPLRSREAGYTKEDLGGYQILMNWRGREDAFITVPMQEVISGKVDPELMRDRIVFIGTIAPSTNDFLETPYSSTWGVSGRRVLAGVFVHANIASQLIQSALYGRVGMVSITATHHYAWIALWTLIGTSGSWYIAAAQQRRQQFRFLRGAFCSGLFISGLLIAGAYISFTNGLLIPVISPLVALGLSSLATTNAYRQKTLKDTNNQLAQANTQLEQANSQLTDYSKTLEIRVEQRTVSLAKAKQVADAANQAKSDFLANMSHELRTPLNGILGYAQILERSTNLAPKEQKGIGIIHQCGAHLLTLINDILDLSKIEARKLELYDQDFDFLFFLEGVAEICRIRAEQKGIGFRCDFAENLPAGIHADEKRLRQVLINLLGNAIKFTDQGHVTFKVETLTEEVSPEKTAIEGTAVEKAIPKETVPKETIPKESVTSSLTQNIDNPLTQKIRFQIEDTGVGMTPAQLEKIFMPFEQVGESDRKAEGTGLGLAISHRIAAMMEAPLQVNSQLDEGSIFWLEPTLKIAQGWSQKSNLGQRIIGIKSITPQPEHQSQDQSRSNTAISTRIAPTVLTIDESPTSRQTIADILTNIGFNVLEAEDSATGINMARAHQPDAVITELSMTNIDGLSLVENLRSDPTMAHTTIVVSSAHVFDEDRQKSLAAGANFFLPKPLEIKDLLSVLQQSLKLEWLYQEASAPLASVAPPSLSPPPIQGQDTPSTVLAPSGDILDQLYHLTMMGDLNALKGMLDQIDADDADLGGFTTHIRALVNQFKTKQIREFIKSFTSSQP